MKRYTFSYILNSYKNALHIFHVYEYNINVASYLSYQFIIWFSQFLRRNGNLLEIKMSYHCHHDINIFQDLLFFERICWRKWRKRSVPKYVSQIKENVHRSRRYGHSIKSVHSNNILLELMHNFKNINRIKIFYTKLSLIILSSISIFLIDKSSDCYQFFQYA